MIKFEDYTPHKEFDTYLLLGSINFYSKEYACRNANRTFK